MDFLSEVADRWGELCRTPARASRAADDFLTALRLSWSPEHRGYFKGTTACLSCLLEAGRDQELLDLIETAPSIWWHYRRCGVRALAAQGRTDEAIRYAEASRGPNDSPSAIARACEAVLLAAGRHAEAYGRYAIAASQAGTHLDTCRAIQKKYPQKDPRSILGGGCDRDVDGPRFPDRQVALVGGGRQKGPGRSRASIGHQQGELDPIAFPSFDVAGNILQIRDPLGRIWASAYDVLDRRISRTDPLGHVTGNYHTECVPTSTSSTSAPRGATRWSSTMRRCR